MKEKEKLLTFKDVCELLQISIHHLRSLVFKKQIPFIKVGRLIRFDSQDLKAWISSNSKNAEGGSNG